MRSYVLVRTHSPHADFPRTQQIYLEQNYRSTSSILAISHAIIAQGDAAAILLLSLHTAYKTNRQDADCEVAAY